MRNLIVSNYVTLDGYFEGPNKEIDWFIWDKEVEKYSLNLLKQIDTILFGRITYELMVAYWPTKQAANENSLITEAMNNLPKIIFSKTLDKVDWKNCNLVKSNMDDEVSKLKELPGKDIVIFGSGSLVSQLTSSGLIDVYHLMLNPIILGDGNSMFKDISKKPELMLDKTRVFSCGNVLLSYIKKNNN